MPAGELPEFSRGFWCREQRRPQLCACLTKLAGASPKNSIQLVTQEHARQNGRGKLAGDESSLIRRRETGGTVLDRQIASALSVGPEWNECHETSYLLLHHHLYRLSDHMKLPNLLPLPKGHRRGQSKARSEIGSTKDQGEPDPLAQRPPLESAPDLQIGTPVLPTPSPLTSRDQGSNGM